MTRPCCPETLTEATSFLNFPILRIGYLYDKGFHGINKQFSEGQLSVFLLQGVETWQSLGFRKAGLCDKKNMSLVGPLGTGNLSLIYNSRNYMSLVGLRGGLCLKYLSTIVEII